MRPGRRVITTMRAAGVMASERSWVTKITVCCLACQIASSAAWRFSLVWVSSAPKGSSISTNSGSTTRGRTRGTRWRTSKATGETAGTSRGAGPKVFGRSGIETRARGATAAGLLVPGLRLLDEAHVHRLLVRDRLLDRGGHPHLHASVVVLLLDHEVPVEDRPVVADGVEHHLPLARAPVGLP